jgi:hypothetical protein
MKKLILILILMVAVSLSAVDFFDFDANSKLHIGCCYTFNMIGHVLSKAYVTENRVWNSIIGTSLSMAVGVKKEYSDADNSFDWDDNNWRDIKDDAIGNGLSIITMQILEPIKIKYVINKETIGLEFAFQF